MLFSIIKCSLLNNIAFVKISYYYTHLPYVRAVVTNVHKYSGNSTELHSG